ncbi:MAG: RNA-binding protein [Clostridia bacterium]
MNNREKFLSSLEKDDKETLAKVFDKSQLCLKIGRETFTSFLSEREYSLVLERQKNIDSVPFYAFGGFTGAGRVMLCFGEEEAPFPISAITITGKGIEKLKHPDFLGSLMSMGIERHSLGDIVMGTDRCVVFAEDAIAGYIATNLTMVGGVYVECSVSPSYDVEITHTFEEISGTVASLRADSVVSVMLKSSRSKAVEYIEGQKFFLNQILCTKCDKEIKENDILTVRHHGKAKVCDISGRSKKGRIFVKLEKYM